jgi:hypothetical protein
LHWGCLLLPGLQIGKIGATPKPLPVFESRVGASGEIEVNV